MNWLSRRGNRFCKLKLTISTALWGGGLWNTKKKKQKKGEREKEKSKNDDGNITSALQSPVVRGRSCRCMISSSCTDHPPSRHQSQRRSFLYRASRCWSALLPSNWKTWTEIRPSTASLLPQSGHARRSSSCRQTSLLWTSPRPCYGCWPGRSVACDTAQRRRWTPAAFCTSSNGSFGVPRTSRVCYLLHCTTATPATSSESLSSPGAHPLPFAWIPSCRP